MTEFFTLWTHSHLTRDQLLNLFGITRKTLYNWTHRKAPAHALATLKIITGDLAPVDFPGWQFSKGQLYSPNGQGFTPREIESIPLLHSQLAAYRTANDHYRKRLPPTYHIHKKPAANDDYKPEQIPVFSDDHLFIDDY